MTQLCSSPVLSDEVAKHSGKAHTQNTLKMGGPQKLKNNSNLNIDDVVSYV